MVPGVVMPFDHVLHVVSGVCVLPVRVESSTPAALARNDIVPKRARPPMSKTLLVHVEPTPPRPRMRCTDAPSLDTIIFAAPVSESAVTCLSSVSATSVTACASSTVYTRPSAPVPTYGAFASSSASDM